MVGVWDEAGDSAEDSERLNFEMGGARDDHMFIEGDEGVVLFVAVEVLDETQRKEVIERDLARLEPLK